MPVGVQCPISSSLGEFPPAIGIGSGVLGFRPYWCPSPFFSPSILGVFHSILSAIGFQSCFFFTADVSPPIRSTLRLLTFQVSYQAWDWLWYPMLWTQRRNSGAHGAENLIQISALAVVEPRTLASRLPRTPPFSRLLRHAEGYSTGGRWNFGKTVLPTGNELPKTHRHAIVFVVYTESTRDKAS